MSKIQWTDETWNPWHGCTKVSPGCKFCYMYRDKDRYGLDPTKVVRGKSTFQKPLSWKEPRLIFTCSWSDFFIEDADEWRDEAWDIIRQTQQHTYQILTKRPERIADCLPKDWGEGYKNVWLGVSIESQKYVNRMWELGKVPAKTRFLSVEPLIGEVDLKGMEDSIQWVIIGGESGNETGKYKYRPCELKWIEHIVRQCKSYNVACFVKQTGTYLAKQLNLSNRHGGKMEEWPHTIQVREFPR